MGLHVEPLSGGLVTSKDPIKLDVGELTLSDNAVYVPWDNFIHSAPGLSIYASSFVSGISGLVGASFDNGRQYLVAQSDGKLWLSQVTASSFASATALTEGTTLDGVAYNNKVFLLNGTAQNRVLRQDGTLRTMGLQPVTAAPGAATGTGVWSQTATGWFEYWTTEVYSATATSGSEIVELESTYVGDPKTIFVASGSVAVTITQPPMRNDGTGGALAANRWRVYRAGPKDVEGEIIFPAGFLVADLPITTNTFNDGSLTQTSFQGVATAVTNTGWTSPLNASTDNGVRATATATFGVPAVVTYSFANFSGITDPVQGIEVQVESRFSTGVMANLHIALSWDGGTTFTAPKGTVFASADRVTLLGGATEKWGREWAVGEFGAGTFILKATMRPSPTNTTAVVTAEVDFIGVKLHYDGTADTVAEEAFPAVVFEVGGAQISEGSNGPPPVGDTGDIYEDSLVINDIANPSFVRYSLAGQPEYFADKYFIDIETPERDIVRNIKALPGALPIGCEHSLWRINYLPRDTDASFDRGKAIEIVDPVLGIVGPRAAVRMRGPGGRTRLAAVASRMLYMTDGFSTEPLSDEIDWPSELNIANIDDCILLNNAENMELLLLFPLASSNARAAASHNGYMYHFSYHPSHIKPNGRLKISGPTYIWSLVGGSNRGILSACTITDANNATKVFMGGPTASSAGRVYLLGGVNANTSDIRTREMYLNGPGTEWTADEILFHHEAASAESVTATFYTNKVGAAEATRNTKTLTPSFRGYSRARPDRGAHGLRVGLRHTPSAIGIAFDELVIRGTDFGREDSGK